MPIQHDPLMALRVELTGRRFKNHRKRTGYSRRRLAKEAGVSYRALQFWDKELVRPGDKAAIKVGRILGLVDEKIEARLKAKSEPAILRKKIKTMRNRLAEIMAEER